MIILKGFAVQSTYIIPDEKMHEREFGNLLKIADSYPKYVVSMDSFNAGGNFKGVNHITYVIF